MNADEFWKDDPQLFVSYRTSFINKKRREIEELDYKCWRQGLYIYDGNSKLLALLRQFINNTLAMMFKGNKDNSKIDTYPMQPYSELEKQEKIKSQEKIKKQKYEDYHNSLIYFGTLKQQYLDKLSKKGE